MQFLLFLVFTDCHDAYKKGHRKSGIYRIQIPGMNDSDVRCDMTEEGGWIVFQRRLDATVDFDRNMIEYINGFGQLDGSYWLGLNKINRLTASGKKAILRVDFKHKVSFGRIMRATYREFTVYGKERSFEFYVSNEFNANTTDGLLEQRGRKFSTLDCKDHDNSLNVKPCSVCGKGGWWLGLMNNTCGTNLNAHYFSGSTHSFTYWSWWGLTEYFGELSFTEMKIGYHK